MSSASSLTQEASRHMQLINHGDLARKTRKHLEEELNTAPLFSALAQQVLENQYQQEDNDPDCDSDCDFESNSDVTDTSSNESLSHHVFPQYGLLGLRTQNDDSHSQNNQHNLIYANVTAPWSSFICGSQGSGKSHTLSCLLENALITSSPAGRLSSPLAGLVLHYDKFTAYGSTQLCEAAYLCSSGIPVRVLVSPTNYIAMKEAYENMPGLGDAAKLLRVVPMYLSQKHLNINVIKTLMGISSGPGQPLYVEFIMKILRDMARTNQGRTTFNYNEFKRKIEDEEFVRGQTRPLQMRLDVLESFFEPGTVVAKGHKQPQKSISDIWQFEKGSLTIVDLSCPFVGPDDACALFNIYVSLFLKDRADAGRMIALDEAHKFLTATAPEAEELTETLLSIIRQQRHLGARVMIATQEPTVSPALLDLCNVTIIHRFTSPAWFQAIKKHIAGATMVPNGSKSSSENDELFHQIVQLKTGEALVFCPTALLDAVWSENSTGANSNSPESSKAGENDESDKLEEAEIYETDESSDSGVQISPQSVSQLGPGCFRLRIRKRVTVDGGRSHIAK